MRAVAGGVRQGIGKGRLRALVEQGTSAKSTRHGRLAHVSGTQQSASILYDAIPPESPSAGLTPRPASARPSSRGARLAFVGLQPRLNRLPLPSRRRAAEART